MQTGDRAGFGKQPNATARRLLSRALWVGGLAVAGSVLGATTANATEAEGADESSGGLLGTLTSAVEPVTDISGSLAAETDTLLTDELALSDDVLSDGGLVGEIELGGSGDRPLDEMTGTSSRPGGNERESAAEERAAERAEAFDANSDRSMRREPIGDRADSGDDTGRATTAADSTNQGLGSLIGTVDRLLTDTEVVPEVGAAAKDLTSGTTTDLLGTVAPIRESARSAFEPQAVTGPVGAVADLMTLFDLPLVGGSRVLQPLEPVLATLGPVAPGTVPFVADAGPLAGRTGPAMSPTVSPADSTIDQPQNTSADAAPRYSLNESGAARPAGHDGESAVIHSSPDAGTDGQDPSEGTRGGLRPSLLVTPVAGLNALHVGAPGAATSVDQAGHSSHALLPEEAVLRARLFSAAAYARSVEAKPQREANDPPVSPD